MPEESKLILSWSMDGKSHTYTVTGNRSVTVGRRLECDIVLPDPSVSRQHATILGANGGFQLRNLSQVNPIPLQTAQALDQLAYNQTHVLEAGMTFQIGPIEFEVTRIEKIEKPKVEKVKCSNCGKLAATELTDCPWCGVSLATGQRVTVDGDGKDA